METKLSSQAENSLQLYRGGSPETIKKMLSIQKKSVVDELKALCKTNDTNELAVRLSAGIY